MTCGYVCPQCEGRGVLDSGENCDYCTQTAAKQIDIEIIEDKHDGDKREA